MELVFGRTPELLVCGTERGVTVFVGTAGAGTGGLDTGRGVSFLDRDESDWVFGTGRGVTVFWGHTGVTVFVGQGRELVFVWDTGRSNPGFWFKRAFLVNTGT